MKGSVKEEPVRLDGQEPKVRQLNKDGILVWHVSAFLDSRVRSEQGNRMSSVAGTMRRFDDWVTF
jgi:hypothetical protein